MNKAAVDRFSRVRLRRHGRRPLCFEGALLIKAGEPDGPQVSLYEIGDGALAVAIELPGYYVDAWRFEAIDEVAEFVDHFDAESRVGFGVDLEDGEAFDASAIGSPALEMGPAYRRVVDSFIRVSQSSSF